MGVSADGSQVGLWSASEVYSPGSEPLRLGPPAFVEVRIRVADAGQGLPSARPLAAHITRIDPDGPGVDVMLGVSGFLHGSWMYSAGAPPGTYELSFGLATYAPVSKQRIELVEGTTTRVTLESPQAALAGHVGRTLPPMRGLASGEPLAGGPTSTGWVRGERDFTVLLFREQWRDESIDDYERTLRDLRDAAKLPAEDRARLRLVLIEARHPALLVRVRDGLQAEEDGAQVPEIVADEDAAYRKVIGVPEGRWSILLDGRGVVIGVSADWYAADAGRSLLDEERAFLRGMARGEDEDGLVADIPWVYLGPHVREWAGKAALGVAGVLNQVQAAK
ncbi:MAG: hypothetical protein KDB73_05015 [Planctomycetes bacterium]|nr:hypothetical protein [Planctomycetota bacterium]